MDGIRSAVNWNQPHALSYIQIIVARSVCSTANCCCTSMSKPGFIIFCFLKATDHPKYNYIISNTISTAQAYYQQKQTTT